MSNHPANLLLRFLLEIAALAGFGAWGWACADGILRVIVTVAFVGIPAAIWGIFRIRNDGGPPVVEVIGPVRLLIEVVFFSMGCYGLWFSGKGASAVSLGVICLLHYLLSYDRVVKMLRSSDKAL